MSTDSVLTGIPNFNRLEVVKTGTSSVTPTGASTEEVSTVVAHNLGFVPVVLAFVELSLNESTLVPMPYLAFNGGEMAWHILCAIDPENVTFFLQTYSNGLGSPFNIRYYLLKETAK